MLQFERPPASLRGDAGAALRDRAGAGITALEGPGARLLHLCVGVERENDPLDPSAGAAAPLDPTD